MTMDNETRRETHGQMVLAALCTIIGAIVFFGTVLWISGITAR